MKKKYRKDAAALLEEAGEEYRSSASDAIAANVLSVPELRRARTVMLYVSVDKEPATLALIGKLLQEGKEVCLPRIADKRSLEARRIKSLDALVPGVFGIPEPADDDGLCPVIPPREIDLALLPCAACDASCNRLGRGAGYYDRFLKTLSDKCATIALCYDKLLMKEIPMEEHDMKVDAVITEKAVHRWRP